MLDVAIIHIRKYRLDGDIFVVQPRKGLVPKRMKSTWSEAGTHDSAGSGCYIRARVPKGTLNAGLTSRHIQVDVWPVHHLFREIGLITSLIPTNDPEVCHERQQVRRGCVGLERHMT